MADTSIGKAYVQIVPKANGISGEIEDLLNNDSKKSGENAGNNFGQKMVGTIKKLVVAAGIGKLFKDSIDAGANLQQSYGGLDTIYGDASDAAKQYAEQAYKAGISANDYAEQAVSFGAALKQAFGGDNTKAVEAANTAIMDMTDNAAKMGTPIESIQNAYQGFAKGNYTMLDNLKLGFGGTKEEMQRLLETAENSPNNILGKSFDINNLGDVYEAIHIIQEDLDLTGVAADEASTTFSGSLGAMKAAAQNVMANLALGENIWPSLRSLETTVKTFLVNNALPMIGNVVKMIPGLLVEIPAFITDLIPDIAPVIGEMVLGLGNAIIDGIPMFITGIGDLIWTTITTIDWAAAGQLIVDLLAAAWDGLKLAASMIWDTIVGIFTGEIDFPDISEAAKTVWNALTTKASEVWTAVKAWFTKTFTWPNIAEGAKTVWNGLTTAASEVWTAIKNWFTKTFSFPSLTQLAYDAWNGLITLASTIWDSIVSWFTSTFSFPSLDELASAAWSTLTGIASGIWSGITGIFGATDISFSDVSEAASTAWSTITTAATTVWDGIKGIFGSFDITWPDFGALAQGALDGLKSAAEGVWNWVKGLFSGSSDDDAVKSVQGSTSEMAATLADAELKISSVDVSSIQEANTFVSNTVLGWMRIFQGMKTWMTLPTPSTSNLQSVSQVISSWISTWKRQMQFTWTLPTPHGYLPSFSVSMHEAGDGTTRTSYPVFTKSLQWFAEGGIFNAPSVIGVSESGSEAVVPLDQLWKQMSAEFDEHSSPVQVTNYFTVDGAEDPEQWATRAARTLKLQLRMA